MAITALPAIKPRYKRENGLWAKHWTGILKHGKFVPVEVADRAEKKQAFQSFGFNEHLAGYRREKSLSLRERS